MRAMRSPRSTTMKGRGGGDREEGDRKEDDQEEDEEKDDERMMMGRSRLMMLRAMTKPVERQRDALGRAKQRRVAYCVGAIEP